MIVTIAIRCLYVAILMASCPIFTMHTVPYTSANDSVSLAKNCAKNPTKPCNLQCYLAYLANKQDYKTLLAELAKITSDKSIHLPVPSTTNVVPDTFGLGGFEVVQDTASCSHALKIMIQTIDTSIVKKKEAIAAFNILADLAFKSPGTSINELFSFAIDNNNKGGLPSYFIIKTLVEAASRYRGLESLCPSSALPCDGCITGESIIFRCLNRSINPTNFAQLVTYCFNNNVSTEQAQMVECRDVVSYLLMHGLSYKKRELEQIASHAQTEIGKNYYIGIADVTNRLRSGSLANLEMALHEPACSTHQDAQLLLASACAYQELNHMVYAAVCTNKITNKSINDFLERSKQVNINPKLAVWLCHNNNFTMYGYCAQRMLTDVSIIH